MQLERHLKGRVVLRVGRPGARHQQGRRAAAAPGYVVALAIEQLRDGFGAAPIGKLQGVAQICQGGVFQTVADFHPDDAVGRTFGVSQRQARMFIHRGRRPGADHEREAGSGVISGFNLRATAGRAGKLRAAVGRDGKLRGDGDVLADLSHRSEA